MQIEIEMIKWLQSFATPQLDSVFEWITMLGEDKIYIFILTLLYWCIDKQLARRLLLGLSLSVWANGLIKTALNMPRPIGVEGIRSLRVETADGASFPSGHTQTIATFMWLVGNEAKRRWVYVFGGLLTLAVAISRLYLGVHWPKDVIGGIVIAIVIGQIAIGINRNIERRGHYMPLFITLVLALASMFLYREIAYVKTVAMLSGFVIGYALEENFVNFDVRGSGDQQLLKYILGIAGIVGIQVGLKLILPYTVLFIFIRYFLMMIWGLYLAPLLFVSLRLSRHRIF
jgi:membrane-associated phospholipid phosphatase